MGERQHTSDGLTVVLRGARQRIVGIRFLDALSLGLAIAMGLLVCLLVLRFQILSAPLLALLVFGAIAIAAGKAMREIPSLAEVSRMLDVRCGLADALSTAFHFQDSPGEIAALQRAQAGKLVSTLDVAAAVPFRTPRSAIVLAGVAGLVLLLGGLRYGVEHRLTLTPPRAAAPGDALSLAVEADTQARERRDSKQSPMAAPTLNTEMTSVGANANSSSVPLGQHATESTVASNREPSAQQPATGEQPGATSKPEEGAASSPRAGSENGPGSQEGPPQSAQGGAKQSSSPSSSGLMSKLRDAVSSLVSKMRPTSDQPPASGQSSQAPNGKQPAGQPSGGKNSSGGENSDAKEGGDQTAGQDSDKQAGAKGQGKGGDQSASAKPGSGMGRQDGSKELRDAEQQAAMGKLSEIIGKRSAGVSGEMSIEPQSGPQQLRTAYSKSSAKHAAGGGDVNREEVPIALQSYVQEYFLQVRKQAAVKTARAGKPETREQQLNTP